VTSTHPFIFLKKNTACIIFHHLVISLEIFCYTTTQYGVKKLVLHTFMSINILSFFFLFNATSKIGVHSFIK
jgi:hypothetical protein